MPWVIRHEGSQYCVYKKGGSKVACHKTRDQAVRQLRALYAAERRRDMAEWTRAFINDLPDSAFLYIESGGKKDSEGKTVPRSLRHFPVKDSSGKVDLAHVRNALARIPQSNVPASVKKTAIAKAQRLLSSAKKNSEMLSTIIEVKKFAEELDQGDEVWIQWAPFGRWSHPIYGDTKMTMEKASNIVQNFHNDIRGQEILTDYDHGLDPAKGGKASGRITDMEVRSDGIYSRVKFTDGARDEIKNGEWRYFSPTFYDEWTHPHTDIKYKDVAAGGGLTNKPWIKGMVPINFSEVVIGDKDVVRYKKEDGQVYILAEDDNEWRVATEDEVKDLEHSEPGTGSPPEPRREGDGSDDLGDRVPSPPDLDENGNPIIIPGGEFEVELTDEQRDMLGISSEDEFGAALEKMFADAKAHRDANAREAHDRTFSEMFPEEAKRLAVHEARENVFLAKEFSENFDRLTSAEGEETVKLDKGFSSLVMQKMEDAYIAIKTNDEDAIKKFSEFVESVNTDKALVDYTEHGSSREENVNVDTTKNAGEQLREYAEKAAAADGMSYGDALAKVMREHPDLARKYAERRP